MEAVFRRVLDRAQSDGETFKLAFLSMAQFYDQKCIKLHNTP